MMKNSLEEKIAALAERYEDVSALLEEAAAQGDPARYQTLAKEHAQLRPLYEKHQALGALQRQRAQAEACLSDPELSTLAAEELVVLEQQRQQLEWGVQQALLPKQEMPPHCFIEIRAGAGGEEAALFSADLLRMYSLYVASQGWTLEALSCSVGEAGGLKESVVKVIGQGAWAALQFESGGHRVQRIPRTEAQGRVHTSACSVVVMPAVAEEMVAGISAGDLRVDTFRASGAGGQHVNKTESAIRITHVPTGLVVVCQEGRSQHQNRFKAMQVLAARLDALQRQQKQALQSQTRRSLLSSGERSDRIRTYNFPQRRVTDHRIGLTLYRLEAVLDGALDLLIAPLTVVHHADQMAGLG